MEEGLIPRHFHTIHRVQQGERKQESERKRGGQRETERHAKSKARTESNDLGTERENCEKCLSQRPETTAARAIRRCPEGNMIQTWGKVYTHTSTMQLGLKVKEGTMKEL